MIPFVARPVVGRMACEMLVSSPAHGVRGSAESSERFCGTGPSGDGVATRRRCLYRIVVEASVPRLRMLRIALTFLICVVAGGCGAGASSESANPAAQARPSVSLPLSDADDGEWVRPAKDFASTRFSALDQIGDMFQEAALIEEHCGQRVVQVKQAPAKAVPKR